MLPTQPHCCAGCGVTLLSLLCDVNTVHTVSGHPVHLHHPNPANEHQSVSVSPQTSRVAPNMPGQPRHSGGDIVRQCVRAEYCSRYCWPHGLFPPLNSKSQWVWSKSKKFNANTHSFLSDGSNEKLTGF